MRKLFRVDDDTPYAWASNRDFCRFSDDTLWAHESHQWLIAAGSGRVLAHRVGTRYYDAKSGQPLYYEAAEPAEALKIVRG